MRETGTGQQVAQLHDRLMMMMMMMTKKDRKEERKIERKRERKKNIKKEETVAVLPIAFSHVLAGVWHSV